MSRVIRILLNAAAVAAFLLGLGVAALWVRSYSAAQYLGRTDPAGWHGLLSLGGLLRYEHGTFAMDKPGWHYDSAPAANEQALWRELAARDRQGGQLKRLGFAYAQVTYDANNERTRYALYFPHWAPLLALWSFPLARLLTCRRRSAATAQNPCPHCGYDCRATRDRCPECGNAIVAPLP